MLMSMTGFGRGEVIKGSQKIIVEMKSVNSRYTDFYIRSPREYNVLDDKIRQYVKERASRGKFDVFVKTETIATQADIENVNVKVNHEIAKGYVDAIRLLAKTYDLKEDLTASKLSRYPDVIVVEQQEDLDSLYETVKVALDDAMNQLLEARRLEGEALKKDLMQKIEEMQNVIKRLERITPEVPVIYKKNLENRISELLENTQVDDTKIAQEVAFFADKCCVDEEIVRLKAHFPHFLKELEKGGSVGRKLDFMTQEINREINTIGSKANAFDVTNDVIELKSMLEKIREQIQNIE